MTMNQSVSEGRVSEINVTPMIDVLLVLLIIFMLIVPTVSRGEAAVTPQPTHGDGHGNAVVLEVLKGSGVEDGFRINQQGVSLKELPGRLAAIYADRADRVLFVKADDALAFAKVATAIDVAHAAGVDRVALLTPKVEAGL